MAFLVLIQYGAQLDVRDKWGQTPLMYCVAIQFPEMVKVLLEADAELVTSHDQFGKAPFHSAVETGNEELVCLLLKFGADINVRCHDGTTPLMLCCTSDEDGKKAEMMQLLLDSGALIDLKDYRGKRTALHVAATAGNVKAVEILIAAGADVSEIDKTLRTPLTLAIYAGVRGQEIKENFMNIISLLVSAGAQLNVSASESCNPLMSSAMLKCQTLVTYFLSLGADPNIIFPSGVTPALVTSSTGDLQNLKALIFHNCDLSLKGNVYKRRKRIEYILDAFELAYMEGHLDMCLLITKAGYRLHGKAQLLVRDLDLMLNETVFSSTPGSTEISITFAGLDKIPNEYKQILDWLIDMATNPRSLTEEAIFSVRKYLGCRLVNGVDTLPIPSSVKKCVLLAHVLT